MHQAKSTGRLLIALFALLVSLPLMAAGSGAASPFRHIKLRNLGPAASGGRVTSVVGIPGNPNVYYIGAAGGGVWKTTDGGDSWKEVLKHGDSSSIGAVAIAPSNPNDVWVGTGEANPRNDITTGHGIYFSPDAGKSWVFEGLKGAGQISRIVVNPTNPKIVYVAVLGNIWKPTPNRGVYMTTDGGKTWKRVLYVNDETGASDVVMDPNNPNVLFAGMWTAQRRPWTLINGSTKGGIWRSTDGGMKWTKLTKGLPHGTPTNRVSIAISRSNPNVVYAIMANADGLLYRSSDMGDHWHMVSNNYAIDVRPFYFSVVAVSPDNPNKVYFGGFHLRESINGGKTSKVIDHGVHVDHHAIWIDPKNPNRIIQGNDGGVYLSVNGGGNWRYLDNLPIEQFYSVSIDHTEPFGVCGGLQDNNAACGPSNSLAYRGIPAGAWWSPVGGDGIYAVPAPTDPNVVYAASQTGYLVRVNRKTMEQKAIRPYTPTVNSMPISKLKYRFNWSAPVAVSPRDANTVYVGADVLFKSTNGGQNWKAISPDLTRNIKAHQPIAGGPVNHDISGAENSDTILSIAISKMNPNVIWVGTDDGLVWVTRDDGKHWSKVPPPVPEKARLGRIPQIGISPFNPGTAYLAVDAHMLGDPHPYVYKTTDYGRNWKRIDRGLPKNYPAFVVREDPNQRGLLALGTDIGLYFSVDDGRQWTRMTGNLPTMPVWDLKFTKHPHDLVLATHGRGLWVFDNLQAIEHWGPQVEKSPFRVFPASVGTEWNMFYGKYLGVGPQQFSAPNPASGPMLSWWLAKSVKSNKHKKLPVTLVVSNASGQTIAILHAPGKAGINRFSWNMRYTGVKFPKFMQRTPYLARGAGPTGPQVLPGTYEVKIHAGKLHAEETVAVRADPRIHIAAGLQKAQLKAALKLRNESDAAVDMLKRLLAMRSILDHVISRTADASSGSEASSIHASAAKLRKEVQALAVEFYNPKRQYQAPEDGLHFIDRFGSRLFGLYRTVNYMGPIQEPTEEQRGLMDSFQTKLQGYIDQFNGSLKQQAISYNRKAYAEGYETVPIGKPVRVAPVTLH